MLWPQVRLKFREHKSAIDKNLKGTKSGKIYNFFFFMIKILCLSFGCRLINILIRVLRLIDTKVKMLKYIGCMSSYTICVLNVLVFVMPWAPGMKMTVLAVLNLHNDCFRRFHLMTINKDLYSKPILDKFYKLNKVIFL